MQAAAYDSWISELRACSAVTKLRPCMTLGVGTSALTAAIRGARQFTGEVVGVAVDVYALGVLAFELVAGALPYDIVKETPPLRGVRSGDSPAGIDAGHCARRRRGRACACGSPRVRRHAGVSETVRGDLTRILDTALVKEPRHRYASVCRIRR